MTSDFFSWPMVNNQSEAKRKKARYERIEGHLIIRERREFMYAA
jgi:hypothetical protein